MAAVGGAEDYLVGSRALERPVETGPHPGLLQVVKELLSLVLEPKHVNRRSRLDVRK